MRHATSKQIFTYWDNLRQNRIAPERQEIEPSDIREILGDTFILEVDKFFQTISFRLAGTRLCSAYGKELKGVGFLGIWDELDNMQIIEAIKQVYENARPCTIAVVAQSEKGKFIEYELVLLPLLNGSSEALRILGTAAPSESPSWLGHDPIINNRVRSVRHMDASCNTPFSQFHTPPIYPDVLPEFSNFEMDEENEPRRVGHLTVLDGGLKD